MRFHDLLLDLHRMPAHRPTRSPSEVVSASLASARTSYADSSSCSSPTTISREPRDRLNAKTKFQAVHPGQEMRLLPVSFFTPALSRSPNFPWADSPGNYRDAGNVFRRGGVLLYEGVLLFERGNLEDSGPHENQGHASGGLCHRIGVVARIRICRRSHLRYPPIANEVK